MGRVQRAPEKPLQLSVEIRPGQLGNLGSSIAIECKIPNYGVIDHCRNGRAEVLLRSVEESFHLCGLGNICLDRKCAQISSQAGYLVWVGFEIVQDDLRALLPESSDDCEPNTS